MAADQNQGMESSSSSNSNRKDPGWKYNFLADPKDPNSVTCLFCNKITKGGIHRAKQHQIGTYRNAKACDKCPPHVKEELENHITQKKIQKSQTFEPIYHLGDDDVDEETEVQELRGGGRDKRGRGDEAGSSKKIKTKASTFKGPMDLYTSRTRSAGKGEKTRQFNMNEACDKELRGRTIQHIARFFYQAGIAFNVARLESFKTMINAIGSYGPNLKPPSYHELRVPLLKKELAYTEDLMKGHKEDWQKYGCSIMSDAWTDRKQRTLINFLVNGTKGTMFVESVDGSSFVKTGEKMFELLDKFVERIGEKNVVQVISDNGSNYVLAGKLLEAKRRHLFWTSCAAHCIDLMLEDIGKIDKIKRTIGRAINLVGFIYNHTFVLNMMREFTNKKELVRCGVTRFATSFLTLQSVYKQKSCLRNMFTSEKWMESRCAKEAKGKKASEVVFMPSFWSTVSFTLKIMDPLVNVLRLVDNEKKPEIGYIYEAIDRAKETIEKSFEGNEEKYKAIFEIIDKRWESQLHYPLHAAGHFLNPHFFYNNPNIESDKEVVTGLYACIERLVPSQEMQDQIMDELSLYKKSIGLFGSNFAKRSRSSKSPAIWWDLYGGEAPKLREFAIKVLSLTCSASGCERNWSMFEQIHSKRRNKLEHQKLQDLVYIKV